MPSFDHLEQGKLQAGLCWTGKHLADPEDIYNKTATSQDAQHSSGWKSTAAKVQNRLLTIVPVASFLPTKLGLN